MVMCMKESATVGQRGQVVIPKAIRDMLGIKPGDKMIVEAVGGAVYMYRQPESYAEALRGLHKNIWRGLDVQAYIDREREEWQSRPTSL